MTGAPREVDTAEGCCDLLVHGTVVTMNSDAAIIEDGAVAISGDRIVDVGHAADLNKRYAAAEEIGLSRGVVLPGLVNCHAHSTAHLGTLLQQGSFPGRLRQHGPVISMLTQEMVYRSSLLSAVKMIAAGTTSCCDISVFSRQAGKAFSQIGMRCWLAEKVHGVMVSDDGLFHDHDGGADWMPGQLTEDPLLTVAIAPHFVSGSTPEMLNELKSARRKYNTLFVVNLAEFERGENKGFNFHGKSPVRYLESLELLDDRVVLLNAEALSAEDLHILGRHDVKVVHCPRASKRMSAEVLPVPELFAMNIALGLGTGEDNSPQDMDLFAEMDFAAKLHKVHRLDPTIVKADQVLYAATMGGAQVLGAADRIGSLEPGKKADLIVLDFDTPRLTPVYNIPSHLVYSAQGADVVHAIINGRIIMRHRQFTTVDVSEVVRNAQKSIEQLAS